MPDLSLPRCLSLLALLSVADAQVSLPAAGGHRFVDWSQELAHPGTVVVVGTLAKWKEGKRERQADGQLGGNGEVASVSGTQYFKVPVTAALQPRLALQGKADGITLTFDLQLARLPDGKERRQLQGGATIDEDALALFVLLPKAKKGFDVRIAIPFDKTVDKGPDAEALFLDTMRDYDIVNRRMHELRGALAAVDGQKDDAGKKAALAALRALLDKKPELRRPANDALLMQHVAPLEQRAEKRLREAESGEPRK